MIFAVALLVVATFNQDVKTDYVDTIEINENWEWEESDRGFGNKVLTCTHSFNQIIFWEDEHIIAWRIIKTSVDKVTIGRVGDKYLLVFFENGRMLKVYAKTLDYSRTIVDPEKEDRKYFPAACRRELVR